jgi:hypothetical protein
MSFIMSLGAFAEGFNDARKEKKADAERAADRAQRDRMLDIMEKQASQPIPQMGAYADPAASRAPLSYGASAPTGGSAGTKTLRGLLYRTEAPDYDTLFGHSQKEGGRFAGVRPTQMTIDELASFTSPKGEYGQWVASRNNGVVATPVGGGQIVGSTLRATAKAMGLPGDTRFTPEVQDRMIDHLARQRLAGASSPAAKRAALRAEWHGFKSVPDSDLDAAIAGFEGSQYSMGATRPVS